MLNGPNCPGPQKVTLLGLLSSLAPGRAVAAVAAAAAAAAAAAVATGRVERMHKKAHAPCQGPHGQPLRVVGIASSQLAAQTQRARQVRG